MTAPGHAGPCPPPIRRALDEHTTLSLAYVDEAGSPGACAVFYARTEAGPLVFLSSADTVHGRALSAGRPATPVAFTAQRDGQTWTDITGIQGRGSCRRLTGDEAAAARRDYARRFPFIDTAPGLSAALAATEFWEIRPHWLRLIDNTRGFGHKTEWTPPTGRNSAMSGNADFETTIEQPVPPQDLSHIVGHRFIYTYANGWQYEMYVKNDHTIDYRIHSGMVGGRWVKDQQVNLVQLAEDSYKISWTEPTGTSVSVDVMPAKRRLHGVIFFPHWVEEHGERTVLYQNDHLDKMREYRDAGPTYPIYVVPEFAKITLFEYVGPDDDTVISVAPGELPDGWSDRAN